MASIVTASSEMTPSPRATIDIDAADLHVDAVYITIWQISKWGQVVVRGAERKNATGGFVVTDYELPAGVEVTYRVEQFDAGGTSLGYASLSLAAEVTIPFGYVVIQDPLAPASAIMLEAQPRFSSSMRRSRPVRKYQAGSKTFAMTGQYSAFEQVPLDVWTRTDEERDQLATILEQPLLLIRTPPEMRLPGAFYAVLSDNVDDTSLARFGSDSDRWALTGDELSRPELEVIVPIYTYDLFKAYLDEKYGPPYATYDDAAVEYATYLDALRNPPPYT